MTRKQASVVLVAMGFVSFGTAVVTGNPTVWMSVAVFFGAAAWQAN